MKKFLGIYLNAEAKTFDAKWQNQKQQILAIMRDDAFGAKRVPVGELHKIDYADVRQSFEPDVDLGARTTAMLKLFHNMRAALHVPDQPPEKAPPSSGSGRNDAFGLLAAGLLNLPQPYSPIKFGLVWNIDKRTWGALGRQYEITDCTQSARIARARRTASWQTR